MPAEALVERLKAGAAFPLPPHAPKAATTFLLVDLEPQFAALLEEGFDPDAYQIRIVAGSEAAFEALAVESTHTRSGRCAVIVGESDGVEDFLRRVRTIHPGVLRIQRLPDAGGARSDAAAAEPLRWPDEAASVVEHLRELLQRDMKGQR